MIRRPAAASPLAATSRPGVTLVEVLVAIMITGVGLLALLTLFPLGALEMAQSFKDDRCGHIKHNAAFIANAWNLRQDPNVQAAMLNPGGGLQSFYQPNTNPPQVNPTLANVQSYPVFVDPNGYWANANNPPATVAWQNWVAGQPGLPMRVTYSPFTFPSPDPNFNPGVNPAYSQQQLLRWTTFLDDMAFPRDDPNGIPEGRPCIPADPLLNPAGGFVDRAPRYSWAYVCRITKAGTPSLVELAVVVYSGRPLNTPATGETPFSAVFTGTVATLTWNPGQNPPDVQPGAWIFDATMTPDPHGYFYRVLSATQTGPTSMDVEVQTPFRNAGAGTVVIMDNVIEVFERGYN
jgi:prepilin-type N-terminal cleavage/methylation domain-containing protein